MQICFSCLIVNMFVSRNCTSFIVSCKNVLLCLANAGKMIFNVNINPITGQFEIEEGGILLANGRGYVPTEGPVLELNPTQKPRDDLKTMNQAEIYSLLALRGLEYGPVFQGIKEAKTDG